MMIHVPSGMTKVLPAHARVAAIKTVRHRWISPSSLTNLVSETFRVSPWVTSNKRVLPNPLHLLPLPHGIALKRAATAGVLLYTSAAMVASLSAR